MVKLGNFFFRYRNVLFPLAFAVAILAGRPEYPFGRPDMDAAFALAGVVAVLLGETLRVLTIGYEYIIRGGRESKVYAETLVQGGVFSHCRNPMYVGNLLIVLGLTLVSDSESFYLIFIPFAVLAYTSIVAAEEAYLRSKFGAEYDDYCRRVNRWWPRWAGFSRSVEGMRFNWKRVLVKEFNTTFLLVVALVGLELLSEYSIHGTSGLPPTSYLIAGAFVWLSLYLLVRTLKKTGRVRG
ncbi:MAG TPA: isoprenylcysteine carboxylmethyltransferase family protein [Burkholderiales bacterium]|nr:isoprenylcysteine carboxylmethyltransferase family protein [Burkholderiales bacterium]